MTMKPIASSHPRIAPLLAALLALVIYLAVSWPLSEALPAKLAQATVVMIAVYLAVRHVVVQSNNDVR